MGVDLFSICKLVKSLTIFLAKQAFVSGMVEHKRKQNGFIMLRSIANITSIHSRPVFMRLSSLIEKLHMWECTVVRIPHLLSSESLDIIWKCWRCMIQTRLRRHIFFLTPTRALAETRELARPRIRI